MVIPSLGKGNNHFMKLKSLTIETLSQECESILKTLPLANYLKVDTIPVVFDKTSETSFFDPERFTINVALCNVAEAIIGSGKTTLSELDLERHLRCLLYHELSHAILTPKELIPYADYYSNNQKETFTLVNTYFANLIEDERIETILKNYYYGVDFKQNIHNICKLEHAKCFENFVFNAVRFRYSPIKGEEVNREIKKFIKRNSNAASCSTSKITYNLLCDMETLLRYLKGIWDELCKMAKQAKEQKNQQKQNPSNSQEDESSSTTEEKQKNTSDESSQSESENTTQSQSSNSSREESEDENEDNKESSESENQNAEDSSQSEEDEDITSEIEDDFNEQDSDSELSDEKIKEIFNHAVLQAKSTASRFGRYSMKISDFECDKNTKTELLKVIVRNCGVGVNQSQAQFGYSGRFNAKRFMKDHNDSCKWFEKRAYEDNQKSKKSSKKILNIWLDQSSSFLRNDDSVNKILKALYEIEKSRDDFEWNLVKVNEQFIIENNKDKRFSCSRGNNALPRKQIEDCYKTLNKTKQEYNIILFDGNTGQPKSDWIHYESTYPQEYQGFLDYYCYESLKVFDNKHSIFITEYSNTKGIKEVCKNAKAIIEENCNYSGVLAQNIIKALDLLF